MLRPLISLLFVLSFVACSDSSDNRSQPETPPDFSEADAWLEGFVATEELFDGVSLAIVERGYGGVVLFEEYTALGARRGYTGVVNQLIPIIEQAIDSVL